MPKSNNRTNKSIGKVSIRMFCHGLGDCFLITIPQGQSADYNVLIDCGVAMGTRDETSLMQEVVRKVADLTCDPKTKRGKIDLLVVTHEHRDHVSGFVQAEDEFRTIDVRNVWFAWTEDPNNPLARALREKHSRDKAALAQLVESAKAVSPSLKNKLLGLNGVSAFYQPLGGKKGKAVDVAEALAIAGSLCKTGKPECLKPGSIKSLPGSKSGTLADQVKVFVLGPPENETMLRRVNPRKRQSEAYEKMGHLGISWTWRAAMAGHSAALGLCDPAETESECERAMPFDAQWRKDLAATEKEAPGNFFRQRYFDSEEQRRIDGDWLVSGAQQLALYMESYTNNTSLVLAFQLPKSKKVLLFVGDAQIGNWISWHELDFPSDDGKSVKAGDLLANTVFYKVGHHGSHNATLREKGLESMDHPELVAMIPVETEAVSRLGYGEMPLESLLKELHKRANGRVFQMDKAWTDGKCPGVWNDGLVPGTVSPETFRAGTHHRPLYIEYIVRDVP